MSSAALARAVLTRLVPRLVAKVLSWHLSPALLTSNTLNFAMSADGSVHNIG